MTKVALAGALRVNSPSRLVMIPYSVTGSYNYTSETGWNWLDLGSDGSVQLGVQDNSRVYQGDAAYLGVV